MYEKSFQPKETTMLGKIVGAVVGILSLAIAQRQGTTTVARPRREKRCRFEGVFILDGTGGVHVLDLAIPLDSANNRVALQHDLADYDVTLGGQLPTAVRYSTAQGEAVRTGPRTFDYTLHFWGLDSSNRRVSLVVSSGTKLFRTLAVYLPSQDVDGDGFPDAGEMPIACVPVTLTGRRMNILPPCES